MDRSQSDGGIEVDGVVPSGPRCRTIHGRARSPTKYQGVMMDWANLIKLVHLALAFALVTGLVGRWSLMRSAGKAEDPGTAFALSQAASPFERLVLLAGPTVIVAGLVTAGAQGYPFLGLTTGWMVISLIMVLVFPFVLAPLVYLPGSRTFEIAMADARAKGIMTSELRAAFANPAVRYARWYEAIATLVVVVLMVFKPF